MIELVFVIVVLGILAALALPRMERDLRQEAADNVLSAIRHTQHLALNDNKTDPFDANWQHELWQIQFDTTTSTGYLFYVIGSDTDHSDTTSAYPSKEETAIDPDNGKYMYHINTDAELQDGESPNILLGRKYGVSSVNPTGGCTTQGLAFDQLGRPHNNVGNAGNNYATYMTSDCNLTFTFTNNVALPFSIIINKETGHAYIDGQEDS
ncbi:MAG TPA: type II secretion system protein [Sulfurovum sp.]